MKTILIKALFSVVVYASLLIASSLLSPVFAANAESAKQVLQRTLGDSNASKFSLTLVEASESDVDWFEVNVASNTVFVKANSPVALSKGAYTFIKNNNFGVVTWEGSNVSIPGELDDISYPRVTSDVDLRMYINPVTYGYTMAWWTWERWEQEIDWMALHGINLPVALLGQEAIWQEVWAELGMNQSKLSDYQTGPGFLPWFRMGNIYNHFGPLPQSWIDKDRELQKNILNRMRQLGMRPIVPAFSGHVPPYFKTLYPASKTYRLENWGGLESEKASILLDPKDPMFTKIGTLFLKKYEAAYGKADLFLADAFNEMLPPVSDENTNQELAEYGEAISKSIREHDPEATWVIQGWTFGHQSHFWNSETTQAFFSRIPKDNLLMLNYGEDRYPIWEKLDAFYGFKWTYGYVHNYGGQQSVFGDLHFYHDEYRDLVNDSDKGNLVGYGVLPEAIENNSIVYEYIFDVPWGGTEKSVESWVNDHLSNRYGSVNEKVDKAWRIALENTYTLREWRGVTAGTVFNWLNDNIFNKYGHVAEFAQGVANFLSSFGASDEDAPKSKAIGLGYGTYVHNNRPTFSGIDTSDYIGNPETLQEVLTLLINELPNYQGNQLYYYDIVDFAQHYTAYKADDYLYKASESYQDGDLEKGDAAFAKTRSLLLALEKLQVITGGSFTKWCEDAISHATTEQERLLYLRNAKAQVTIWGGDRLKDYASKSWSGLLENFYLPRWEMFFSIYKESAGDFDQGAAQQSIREWEEAWVGIDEIPQSPALMSEQDSIDLIKQILSDY